jgi:hypothetical protein
MKPIVTIFEEIVANVRAKYDLVNDEKPYYMHGHPVEIANILSQKDGNSEHKYKKYPAICLMQDFEEEHTAGQVSANLNIVIFTETKQDYEASERYNDTFKNELIPLFDLLISEIIKSKYLDLLPNNISFRKTDRLFWGRSNSSIMNDFIDAIEIENLNLTFHKFC